MNPECKSCEDRDRSAEICALSRRLPHAFLVVKAVLQAIDERGPMLPMDAIGIEIQYKEGNTPRQLLHQYTQDVAACIDAHRPAQVHRIY